MVSSFEDIKAKAIAEIKMEIEDKGSAESSGASTREPEPEAMGETPKPDKKALMKTFCRIPFVNEIAEDECERLAEIVTVRRLEKGDVLIEQGKKDNSLYILITGRLQVNRSTGGNKQVTLACIREGEMAGEMGFLDDSEHSATLMADDTSQILQINRKDLEGLLDEHPQTVYKLMRAIAREVHKITQRMNMQFVEMSNYIHHQQGRY
ncbi:MAG: Crp/Fnr family transcriptional regulator [Chromatiaceae bacterium]|nr:Crp/Fnr family transcriptional regulator [Chromatiaceae bacterium]